MSNTLIILAVLGIVNLLIRKFAASKTKNESITANEEFSAKRDSSGVKASAEPTDSQPTWWVRVAKELQEASEASASGNILHSILKSSNPSQTASKAQAQVNAAIAAAAAARAASKSKPAKVKRVSQAPIGVTYSQKAASQSVQSSAGSEPDTKPISAIDSLIASRMSQKIGDISASNRPANRKRVWTARSMRQGVIMAEILAPPIALRSPR